MFNYMRGEFYRIRHKKSLYVWLAVAAAIAVLPVLGGGSLSGDAGIALQLLLPMTRASRWGLNKRPCKW